MTTDAEEASEEHTRRLRLRAWTNRLRESLLFLPLLLLLASVVVEELAAWIDHRFQLTALGRFALPPDAAVTLLSTVAGATITTAGVVFSLLVVTLQLASGQFSPRVLRTFWRDRFGQVLIGLLLATFTFCVLALTQIDTSSATAPPLTMALALLLALGSILTIVAYLNRLTRHQYVGRIVERIAEETLLLVRELPYGDHVGVRVGVPVDPPDFGQLKDPLVVRSATDGWIQQISRRAVVAAVPAGSVVRLETRVGAYLVAGEPVASVWLKGPTPERMSAHIREAVIVGNARTMQQDVDFGLRQLNDIALRALSPAVNDPTTAVEVVVRVGSVMRPLVRTPLADQSVRTAEGTILLTPWDLDHAEYVAHAFAQLRLYAAPHPQVAMAIVRSLRMLRAASTQPLAGAELDRQLELTLHHCERADLLPADLAAVRAVATGPTSAPAASGDAAAGTAGSP